METNILETINPKELGEELQKARKRCGLTQDEAAQVIEVARTTLLAIEKGERRIRAGELIRLARAYGRQVSDFVRPRPSIEPFQIQFRGPVAQTETDKAVIASCIDEFEELCRDYLELEEITATPLISNYPSQYIVNCSPITQAAESVAIQERNRLGLGDGPIPVLRDILEQDVGIRIFFVALPDKFSAMYHYDQKLGGCIAINSKHPEERRRFSLAHDYGHFLAHRFKPEILISDGYERKPESEQFADSFAQYLLMPTSSLTRRFYDLRRSKEDITAVDICWLAYYYGVSAQALTLRLEEMRLLPAGTWRYLQDQGLRVREVQQQLGLEPIPTRGDKLPQRYQLLALDALERDLITEEQFANFMQLDLLTAHNVIKTLHGATGDIASNKISTDLAESATT